jgi:hypothetical protein
MKNDKPKTLDSARVRIAELEHSLSKATNAETQLVTQNIATIASNVSTNPLSAKPGPVPTVALPARTPEDLNLPETTEADLENAIGAEKNYKARWLLQRQLARLQEARAQNEVAAKRGRFLGTMEIRRRS